MRACACDRGRKRLSARDRASGRERESVCESTKECESKRAREKECVRESEREKEKESDRERGGSVETGSVTDVGAQGQSSAQAHVGQQRSPRAPVGVLHLRLGGLLWPLGPLVRVSVRGLGGRGRPVRPRPPAQPRLSREATSTGETEPSNQKSSEAEGHSSGTMGAGLCLSSTSMSRLWTLSAGKLRVSLAEWPVAFIRHSYVAIFIKHKKLRELLSFGQFRRVTLATRVMHNHVRAAND